MEELALYGESSAGPSRRSTRQSTEEKPKKSSMKGKGKAKSKEGKAAAGGKRARSPDEQGTDEQAREETEPPATQEIDELYVSLRTDVVGVQYYTGLVGTGEYVMLRREPHNRFDSNAVQVLNASGTQVGHIPRAVAAQLAPLMDSGLITVEGRMIGQNLDRRHHYKLSIDLPIYARASYRQHLEPVLEWATPDRRGFDYMRQHGLNVYGDARLAKIGLVVAGAEKKGAGPDDEMKRILDGLTKVNEDEKAANSVMAALTSDLDVAKLPLHPSPPSLSSGDLLTDLLPHQSQALQWMIAHENPVLPQKEGEAAVQFWARQGGKKDAYWLNVATKTPQDATPVLGRGGIVADGMGLGKTLATLALVLATKSDAVAAGYSGATLIVCPLSVLSNWEKQIQDHVAPGKLSWYTYHGAGKAITASHLAKYDIVLTTYQTIAGDVTSLASPAKGKKVKTSGSKGGPLAKIKWKRVVADEGHVMKNPKAKMTQAFVELTAERRWVVTGTPIVNAPNDLGSLLTCIKVCAPLDQHEYFRSLVLRPLKTGASSGGRLLQAIVGQCLLRRTKDTKDKDGNKIITLPEIEYYQCPIKLDRKTREIYDEVMKESVRRFQESMDRGESDITILSMITRMRQLCLSADLIPENYLQDLKADVSTSSGPSVSASALSREEREKLFQKLRQAVADQEECSICIDILDDPRITDCGHAFCLACITEVIRRQTRCPMDRHPISEQSLLQLPPDDEDDAEVTVAPPVRSAKILELLRYLSAFDKDDKTLVFSQFTTFLDRVAAVLLEEGIPFCRFDGSMSAKKRQEVIMRFQTPVSEDPETPVVMLISLKSGAVGLNLTAASNVFLCDPWWQSAIEAQAVDRVHRMGQRKTVRVFQLIAEDTIEARVLDIRAFTVEDFRADLPEKRKDALVAKAFERSGTKESKQAKKQARFEELKEIFGV